MKYKTFRALVVGGLVAVALVLGWALRGCFDSDSSSGPGPATKTPKKGPTRTSKPGPQKPTQAPRPKASSKAPADPGAMRPVDVAIFSRVKRGMSGTKVKDALKGRAWKVNLYGAGGTVERLKLDLNRNNKWDEKWTFEADGKVKRAVAPADDERYTVEWRLRDGRWVRKGARPQRPPTTPKPAPPPRAKPAPQGDPLRPVDEATLRAIDTGISGKKAKDLFPSASYKVSLYADAGSVNRAKLDLDRDGKWDEKWTIEGRGGQRKIKRSVAPADDEQYRAEYRLREGVWVKKK